MAVNQLKWKYEVCSTMQSQQKKINSQLQLLPPAALCQSRSHHRRCSWGKNGLLQSFSVSSKSIHGSHCILVLKFKDFQGPWSCIFKYQFSMEVYSMDSITAIFNIYFCDYGTVFVNKNKTWQLLASSFRQNTCLTNSWCRAVWLGEFKNFQGPVLFSSSFKALNLGEKNSSTFKDF